MEPLVWSNRFSIGVDLIDFQHQHIFELLNQLFQAADESELKPKKIQRLLNELSEASKEHFASEEKLIKKHSPSLLKSHQQRHLAYYKKTSNLKTTMITGEGGVPDVLRFYLHEWWKNHILNEDMRYKEYIILKDG